MDEVPYRQSPLSMVFVDFVRISFLKTYRNERNWAVPLDIGRGSVASSSRKMTIEHDEVFWKVADILKYCKLYLVSILVIGNISEENSPSK